MTIEPVTLKINLQEITINLENVEKYRNAIETIQFLQDLGLFEDDSVYAEVSKDKWRTTEKESSDKLIEYLESEVHKMDLLKLSDWRNSTFESPKLKKNKESK